MICQSQCQSAGASGRREGLFGQGMLSRGNRSEGNVGRGMGR